MQFGRVTQYGFGRLGGLLEDPSTIAEGLLFWGNFSNIPRTSWSTSGYQINNNVATLPPAQSHVGMDFTEVNSDYINYSDIVLGTGDFTITFVVTQAGAALEYILGRQFTSGYVMFRNGAGVTLNDISNTLTPLDSVNVGINKVITITRSGTDVSLYVDGNLEDTGTASGGFTFNRIANGAAFSDITLKDVAIFPSALGTDVITSIAEATTDWITLCRDNGASLIMPLSDYDPANGARTAGDVVLDYSGNGNHGTIQGTSVTPVYTPAIGFTVEEGQYNEYVNFLDTNDNVDLNTHFTTFDTTTNSWSISGSFIYQGGSTGFFPIFNQQNNTGTFAGINLYIDPATDKLFLAYGNDFGGGDALTVRNERVITENVLTTFTVTYDGSKSASGVTIAVNQNGVNYSTVATVTDGLTSNTAISTSDAWISARNGSASYKFYGIVTSLNINNESTYVGSDWLDRTGVNDGAVNGTPDYIKSFSTGTQDLFGDTISFTGAAAPDGKLYTGGAIDFTIANSDYVDTPVPLGTPTSYEIFGWAKFDNLADSDTVIDLRDGTNDGVLIRKSVSNVLELAHNSASVSFAITNNTWYFIHAYWDGADISLFAYDANGDLVNSATTSVATAINTTTNARIGAITNTPTNFDSGLVKDFYVRTNQTSLIGTTILNNPNKFVETAQGDANCLFAYDFNNGTYSAGSPVIDVSGNNNHGTVQGATAEMALNNIEVGSQTALHGWSLYKYFDGTDDIIEVSRGAGALASLSYEIMFLYDENNIDGQIFYEDAGDANGGLTVTNQPTVGDNGDVGISMSLNSGSTFYSAYITGLTHGEVYTLNITTDVSTPSITVTCSGGIVNSSSAQQSRITFSVSSRIRIGFSHSTFYYQGYIPKVVRNGVTILEYNTTTGTQSGTPVDHLIPSITDLGTTDIFGNTVQRPWKAGVLNFSSFTHDGMLIGDVGTLTTLYSPIKTFLFYYYKYGTASARLINNRSFADGYAIELNVTTGRLRVEVETGAVEVGLDGATSSSEEDDFAIVEVQSDGLTSIFHADSSNAFSSDATPTITNEMVETGETPLRVAVRGNAGGLQMNGRLSPIIYSTVLTAAQQEKLRKYLIKLIP